MNQRTTSGAWVHGVTAMFASQQLDAAHLCAGAGIDSTQLSNPNYRCATERVSALWNAAIAASANPDLALTAPHLVQPANFEVVGFVMMSSDSVRAALERLQRYLRIVSDAATVEQIPRQGQLWVELELDGGAAPIPSQRFVYDLLALLTFLRWGSGNRLRPLQVALSHHTEHAERYVEVFQCPVQFGAPRNAMAFKPDDLDQPMLAANAGVAQLHDQHAGQRLEQLNLSNTSFRARAIIVSKLPDGEPRREQVAAALCMSDRTLLRRLQDDGTSYNQLLDSTRRELAQRYLRQKDLSLAQIAYLLGFADQSNLFRACKRWFDLSPSQYRAQT